MSSPLSAQVGEVTAIARPLEGRLCLDVLSEASSDAAEDFELPHCKIRRNYNCAKCTFYTQNPRAYLLHTRDVHFGRFKIYDCQHCMYASQHHQKLLRHMKMVHGGLPAPSASTARTEAERPAAAARVEPEPGAPGSPEIERMEDLLEEIEECDDIERDEDGDDQSDRLEDCEPRGSNSSRPKGKGKFFSCDKCNYVTHIKARYTKHVKYHSMPMIKCTMCDFRTPYKWNLDRHMKNHGGTGNFVCSKCTFTADIKQSLTVHEMNHHTPPVGHGASRRRNRVGASDMTAADPMGALLPKEEEGSADSHSSHSASVSFSWSGRRVQATSPRPPRTVTPRASHCYHEPLHCMIALRSASCALLHHLYITSSACCVHT